jgi:hypothetical protein
MTRFSIVIPTRERDGTLPYTLETCLAQDFDDFEIVVADNFSSPPTREIVESIPDKRIKYVRSSRPLAMSDSWEFALLHASGEYVTVVGADDGLLLHALPEVDRLLRMLDTPILRWESACYNWPDLPVQDHAPAHALLIPLKQANDYYPIHRRDSAVMMQAAANSRLSYNELPMIQCAAIHRSVIDHLRARSGRVFQGRSPDIYSSFAFAQIAGSYHSVAAPMTINGLSAHSNGVACIYLKEKSPIAEEFRRLNAEARLTTHPWVPDVPVMPAGVADAFLHARDALFPNGDITLDRRQLAINCIQEARLADDREWQRFREAIRRSLTDDAELLGWFEREYGERSLAALNPTPRRLKRYGGDYMYLDASEFGVTNIFEAAQLCERLLGCKREGVNCHMVSEPAPDKASAPTTMPGPSATVQASGLWRRLRAACHAVLRG